MQLNPTIRIILAIGLFIFLGTVLLERCRPKEKNKSLQIANNEFIGAQSCKTCHSSEYHDWLQSHHFKAMEPANDTTVEGDFNNSTLIADGITSRFYKKEGKFFINTEGNDGNNHDYEVKFTFGFTPLQQYLVEFPGGRMQVPRIGWDTKQKKWFHQYPGQKIQAPDWLHWTGNSQNWNTYCASCHSTNLQKNYSIDQDSYNTTYSVINVSCESCHGPGKLHVDFVSSSEYKKGGKIPGSYVQWNKGTEQLAQINACAPCHARKSDISASLIHSSEIMDNYIPEIPTTEHYYADGQANDEDYIYTSFLQSKMSRRDVKCSHCHNPHSGKILLTGNNLCLQCHEKKFDDPSHTFHPAGIAASECKSCHMPGKYYMGNDYRYDHTFRVPRPDLTVKYGTPNACVTCHNNKPALWLADAVIKWYGPERKYHFAEDLVPGSKQDEQSEAHLIKLIGDTSVPDIVKATAANYLGAILSQKSFEALLYCLDQKDAQIKYRALRSLSNFPVSKWQSYVGPLLSDKVRAVRIAAADLYSTIPLQQIATQYLDALAAAKIELKNYLLYQADFSVGNVMIADHYLQQQDFINAEKFYLRGLKKDSLMNYARLNLASAYNIQGKNQQALQTLETAAKVDPGNERIFYNMALLYYELNNKSFAETNFKKAIALRSVNPRVFYNYGLLLSEDNRFKEAEKTLEKGIGINPADPDLYFALAHVYIKSNELMKAKQTAIKLKKLNPANPNYLDLFKNLGI